MSDDLHQLADDALDHLVHQFARPMDFVRELIQNSIDAGTPRIEVWVDWNMSSEDGTTGIVEIHVDDFGEGMDEAVIDAQLTRMFSSTKENDLTKIGKFGIGFTSVFAIQPSAVLVHTGRHGESWELLFHPDRSFDKVRLSTPVRGTQVTVFKSLDLADVAGTIGELKWVLEFWCEHSDVPILFSDRRDWIDTAAPESGGDDPWGAFGEAASGAREQESMARPMDLDTPYKVRLERDGMEVVVGYEDTPHYAFFNGGITLVRSTNPESLGPARDQLSHLSFKVKSRMLEHTLTRDNVLQDTAWTKAIGLLKAAAETLRPMLLDWLEAAVRDGTDEVARLQRYLSVECGLLDDYPFQALLPRAVVRDWRGQPVRIEDVVEQACKWKAFLLVPDSQELAGRMESEGMHLLDDAASSVELLRVLSDSALTGRIRKWVNLASFPVLPADDLVVVPKLVKRSGMTPLEWDLLKSVERVVQEGSDFGCSLHLVSLGVALGDASVPFVTIGEPETEVCAIRNKPRLMERWHLLEVDILVNRDHPSWHVFATTAAEYPLAARMGLAQAIAGACGLSPNVDLEALSLEPVDTALEPGA
jgi:hypothetical protein